MKTDYSQLPQMGIDFLAYMETIKNKSPNTVKEYYYDLRMYMRFLKVHKQKVTTPFNEIDVKDVSVSLIENISLSDLYSFMTYLSRDRKSSARTRARKVATLKSFYKFLHTKAKIIDKNITVELDSPKIIKDLPRFLTIDESKSLLNHIQGEYRIRDYAIITIFLNCGVRISELVDIKISKIKNNSISIIGKGNKERMIYLNNACIYAIKNYMLERPIAADGDKDYLFLSRFKKRLSRKTVHIIVKKHLLAAGLDPNKYSAHKLRHTSATLMYRYGNVDIRSLQQILGHESIATTEIYTHVDNEQLRNAMDSNPLANLENDTEK